jgi:hypothetical protein
MSSPYSIGAERYRLSSVTAATAATMQNTGLHALPTPASAYGNEGKPWHPASPLFPFAIVAALTFGLMAVSTSGTASVRLGKAVATVGGGGGVGSTK